MNHFLAAAAILARELSRLANYYIRVGVGWLFGNAFEVGIISCVDPDDISLFNELRD